MLQNSNLLCFAGAGGTGKTALIEPLVDRLTRGGYEVCVHKSAVREFYATNNVPDEAAFLGLSATERYEFQMRLFAYYLKKLSEALEAHPSALTICERSVFDHVSYTLYGTRELVTPRTMNALTLGVRRFITWSPSVFYLPYPTPWDAQGADGFRARELAKDTIVDALIYRQLSVNRGVWRGTLPHITVEARVNMVVNQIIDRVASAPAIDADACST